MMRPLFAVLAAAMIAMATATSSSQVVAVPAHAPAQPVFSARSELVVLQATVVDSRGRQVRGLDQGAFTVLENGEPQQIKVFSGEDAPATIGILIDNSGSMQPSRERVIAALLAFAQQSHPEDEVFVLTFNEHVRLAFGPTVLGATSAASFGSSVATAVTATGLTAIYDAVADGLPRLQRGSRTRQVLIVVSDGSDNASAATEADVIKAVHDSDATIYAVTLADPFTRDANPGLLRRLTRATGGKFFHPQTSAEMPGVLEAIARDIRSAYTLAYAPSGAADGVRRMIRVEARSGDGKRLSVRSRDGYFLKTIGGADD